MAEVRQRNADGVIDLGRRGEGRIEILPVKLAHQLEGDLARNLPMELPAGKFAGRFASHMDGEGWGRGVKELLSMIVGEDDPEIGHESAQALADVSSHLSHACNDRLIFSIR